MPQLRCACGAIIHDTLYPNPVAAKLISEIDLEHGESEIDRQNGQYISAVIAGTVKDCLKELGFGDDYVDLGLSHAEIMSDIRSAVMRNFTRDVLECAVCGRLAIEVDTNLFSFFSPDSGEATRMLEKSRSVSRGQ